MSIEIERLIKRAESANNYYEAIEWYKKAVELGDLESRYQIGFIYYYRLQPQQHEEGARWWLEAAKLGHPKSQRTYGWYLLYGIWHTDEQRKEGWDWYRKAAENGDIKAQMSLAGQCDWERKYDEAEHWWTLAAEQGDTQAQTRLGREYFTGYSLKQDYEKALYWWRKAAEKGDKEAAYNLGFSYYKGDCTKKDYAEALKWLRQSAASDNSEAKYLLAQCYELGLGTEKDLDKAKTWYASAAAQGHQAAQSRYEALLIDEQPDSAAEKWSQKGRAAYEDGNIHEAIRYFTKAAELGDVFAQYSIGFFYYDGQGVKQDRGKARIWLGKAASQGHKHAKELLKTIKKDN